jgi:CHAT domain-containing protein
MIFTEPNRKIFILLICFLAADSMKAQTWKQYSDSAVFYREQKNPDKAIEFFQLAKKNLPPDSALSSSYIQITSTIARLYYDKSQYAEAEPFYVEAKEAYRKNKDTLNEQNAGIINFTGIVYYRLKRFPEAEKNYFEALEIWEKLFTRKSAQYANSHNLLAVLYDGWGLYEKAAQHHLIAISTREQLLPKEYRAYAQSCNNLAGLYWSLGQYEKAEPLALKAKEIRGRESNIPRTEYAITCIMLANIYRDMGKYEQAESLYLDARKIREESFTRLHEEYAATCNILADVYYYMQRYSDAENLYVEAKDIREKLAGGKLGYNYGQSCNNLASLYRETGAFDKAVSYALEARRVWEKILPAESPHLTVNNNNLASLYLATGKFKDAEKYFPTAREQWKKSLGIHHPSYTENSLGLAKAYWNLGELEKANDLYKETFAAQTIQVKQFFAFTSEIEKQLYLQRVISAGDEYQSFYFDKMRSNNEGMPYKIALQKKNQILGASSKIKQLVYEKADSSLTRKYHDWTAIKKQLAALYTKANGQQDYIKSLEQQADILEKEITRLVAVQQESEIDAADWEKIRQKLNSNEAAIEFIEFSYFNGSRWTDSIYYAALLLKKESPEPEMILLCEKKQLSSFFSTNLNHTIASLYTVRKDVAVPAYELVWKPLENSLKGIETIYYAASGDLHKISFAALPVNEKELLSDRFQLTQVNSTASIVRQQPAYLVANSKLNLYGAVAYDADTILLQKIAATDKKAVNDIVGEPERGDRGSKWIYLPGTEVEIKEIENLARAKSVNVQTRKNEWATEESFKALNGSQSPYLLHIATHGFFFKDPTKSKDSIFSRFETSGKLFKQASNPLLRSGIVFAGANYAWQGKQVQGIEDGILTAYEVSNLYFPNTKLVVLSACETALGDIKGSEGVYGLQRAFKMAGVEYLLMSLWKVPDVETAEFMQAFYRNFFASQSIDNAFAAAQTQMKNKYRYQPYKWAAWILVR